MYDCLEGVADRDLVDDLPGPWVDERRGDLGRTGAEVGPVARDGGPERTRGNDDQLPRRHDGRLVGDPPVVQPRTGRTETAAGRHVPDHQQAVAGEGVQPVPRRVDHGGPHDAAGTGEDLLLRPPPRRRVDVPQDGCTLGSPTVTPHVPSGATSRSFTGPGSASNCCRIRPPTSYSVTVPSLPRRAAPAGNARNSKYVAGSSVGSSSGMIRPVCRSANATELARVVDQHGGRAVGGQLSLEVVRRAGRGPQDGRLPPAPVVEVDVDHPPRRRRRRRPCRRRAVGPADHRAAPPR